jgi:hypothetical protein
MSIYRFVKTMSRWVSSVQHLATGRCSAQWLEQGIPRYLSHLHKGRDDIAGQVPETNSTTMSVTLIVLSDDHHTSESVTACRLPQFG